MKQSVNLSVPSLVPGNQYSDSTDATSVDSTLKSNDFWQHLETKNVACNLVCVETY